jgi:hypothetical protein
VGVDETLERRRGKKQIVAKGVYRDPVRSSHSHFVKTSALRWVSVALLAPIPWASRVWALPPFLCALAPSERYCSEQGEERHNKKKKITEWAWQLLLLVRRWYPEREIRRRTAAALLGLFSLVTLLAHQRTALSTATARRTAWYDTSNARPFPMPWRWYVRNCGRRRRLFASRCCGTTHGESPAGVRGAADRCGLLRSLMAKVQLSLSA